MLATSNLRFVQLLQTVFEAQARDVLRQLTLEDIQAGKRPNLSYWITALAVAVQPLLLQYWRHGALLSQRRVAALLQGQTDNDYRSYTLAASEVFATKEYETSGHRWKAAPGRSTNRSRQSPPPRTSVATQWNLLQPQVLDAVAGATLLFCQETNDTAVKELDQALDDLRQLLKRGAERGDAIAYLAKKTQQIFADPYRSYRIATTEIARAMNGGALLAAKENPVVGGKQWLASSDACELCADLDGVEKKLDEPFLVLPGSGPYRTIMHPPAHPHCSCTFTETLA